MAGESNFNIGMQEIIQKAQRKQKYTEILLSIV